MQQAGRRPAPGRDPRLHRAISERELTKQVRRQAEEVVFELMSWSEGYFSFQDGSVAGAPSEALIRTPTGFLLMEAARRIDEWSRIEKKIPHLGIVPSFAPATDAAGSLDLLPDEWELLGVVDGSRDVRALASSLGRPEFDVAQDALRTGQRRDYCAGGSRGRGARSIRRRAGWPFLHRGGRGPHGRGRFHRGARRRRSRRWPPTSTRRWPTWSTAGRCSPRGATTRRWERSGTRRELDPVGRGASAVLRLCPRRGGPVPRGRRDLGAVEPARPQAAGGGGPVPGGGPDAPGGTHPRRRIAERP